VPLGTGVARWQALGDEPAASVYCSTQIRDSCSCTVRVLRVKGQSLRIERKWIVNLVVMGLFSTTLYQIFFLYGVRYAHASDDSLVIGIGPVLVAIMASLVLRERLTKRKGLGFVAGLAGIGVISLL